jgi:hypothetical protein
MVSMKTEIQRIRESIEHRVYDFDSTKTKTKTKTRTRNPMTSSNSAA